MTTTRKEGLNTIHSIIISEGDVCLLYMQDNPAYLTKKGGYKYGYVVYDSCTVAQFKFLRVPSRKLCDKRRDC